MKGGSSDDGVCFLPRLKKWVSAHYFIYEALRSLRQDRKRVGCVQLPAFFCRPLFRKGFVSISISDHPPGIRIFCCSRWERSFFFAIPHFGRILFSLVWISSPSNLMNSPCAFFSLLVVKRIAIFRNYSSGRFSLSWRFSFVIPHSPCVLVFMPGDPQ